MNVCPVPSYTWNSWGLPRRVNSASYLATSSGDGFGSSRPNSPNTGHEMSAVRSKGEGPSPQGLSALPP